MPKPKLYCVSSSCREKLAPRRLLARRCRGVPGFPSFILKLAPAPGALPDGKVGLTDRGRKFEVVIAVRIATRLPKRMRDVDISVQTNLAGPPQAVFRGTAARLKTHNHFSKHCRLNFGTFTGASPRGLNPFFCTQSNGHTSGKTAPTALHLGGHIRDCAPHLFINAFDNASAEKLSVAQAPWQQRPFAP